MSVRVMQSVWEHSRQSGGALVLLLAIADNAHDDGDGAYPSNGTLAKKARMTGRNVNMLIKKLEEDGEITIRPGAGPNRCNVYRVLLPGLGATEQPQARRDAAQKACAVCGEPPDDWHELHRHHRTPRHEGGSNRAENLILLCYRCHGLMHDKDHRQALTPLGIVLRDQGVSGVKTLQGENIAPEKSGSSTLKNPVVEGEILGRPTLKRASPKPLVNHHTEPSVKPSVDERAKRATRIPDDFPLTDQMRDWLQENRPDLDPDLAHKEFCSYWRGEVRTKLDWRQTWENGMLKSRMRRATGPAAFNGQRSNAQMREDEMLTNVYDFNPMERKAR